MLGIILILVAGGFSLAENPVYPVGSIGPVYYTHSPYEVDVPQAWVGEEGLLKGWARKISAQGTYPEHVDYWCANLWCYFNAWNWWQLADYYESTDQGVITYAGTLHITYIEPPPGFSAVLDLNSFQAIASVNVQGTPD